MALREQSTGTKQFQVSLDLPEMPVLFNDERQGELNRWWVRVRETIEDRDRQLSSQITSLGSSNG